MPNLISPEAKWLLRNTRAHLPLHAGSIASILAGSVLVLIDPLIVKWIIDEALPKKNAVLLAAGILAFCLVFAMRLAMIYCASLMSYLAAQKLMFRLRVRLFRHITGLSSGYHDKVPVGDLLYRLDQDVAKVAELGSELLPGTIRVALTSVAVIAAMALLDFRLAVLVFPLVPPFYFLQRRDRDVLKRASDETQGKQAETNAFLQEHVAAMQHVQLLNRESLHVRKYAHYVSQIALTQVRQKLYEIRFSAASMSIIVAGTTLVLGYGGYQVLQNALTVGGLVAFYTYVVRLFEPLTIAVDLQTKIQRAGASTRRLLEIESATSSVLASGPQSKTEKASLFGFSFVNFSYRPGRPVLRNVSFAVDCGETVAIVGRNGSGKSTIGLLAVRLYDPDGGTIYLRGKNICKLSRRYLRSKVTLVPSEPVLFSGTIRQNIVAGSVQVSSPQLERVLWMSLLEEVLGRFPQGLEEMLGPKGIKLSGGEKKRIALARALLHSPEVLILDEFTNGLDNVTAARILGNLESQASATALIAITHHLPTIAWADRVLLIERGEIVAEGTHSSLIANSETYKGLLMHSARELRVGYPQL